MRNFVLTLSSAVLLAGSSTLAFADAKSLFEGNAACAKTQSQCLRDGVKLTLATTPAEGQAILKSNMDAARACDEAARACYEAVKAPHEFIAD